MMGIAGRGRVSMLVTKVSSTFTKKADEAAYFACTDGPLLRDTIQRALDTGEGQTVTVISTARLKDGTEVSQTEITWSFKKKLGK
jgi:glucokinase